MIANWIGIPYVVRGRLPDGLDCWGLVREYTRQTYGRELPDYLYEIDSYLDDSANYLHTLRTGKLSGWQSVSTPLPGDLVTFMVRGLPLHCGVYIGADQFLHSLSTGQGSTIECLSDIMWVRRLTGIWRYAH